MIHPEIRRPAAVDVHYPAQGGAIAAVVIGEDAFFSRYAAEKVVHLPEVAPYESGRFFVRELPAIRLALADIEAIDLLIIDGYVHLDPAGRPGLGAYLSLEFSTPIIGVAKTFFKGAVHSLEVYRGRAAKPLYITSSGMDPAAAALIVERMAGAYRLPDALRYVDGLGRRRHEEGDQRLTPRH